MLETFCSGPQVLIGSSMGAWLALLLARDLSRGPPTPSTITGMVLIAPAVDFTDVLMWQRFPPEVKAQLAS